MVKRKAEYAHVLAGIDGGMARFQLVFEDGVPVDEFRIPVGELDRQRPEICDAFLRDMRLRGITSLEKYRFVDQTLREPRRGKNSGYGTINAKGLGDIQRMKYEEYLRTSLMEGDSRAA